MTDKDESRDEPEAAPGGAEPRTEAPFGRTDSPLGATLRESAQQIWLAGMGAFAKAQQEGGKAFDALIKEGLELQKRAQAATGQRLAELNARTPPALEKLEAMFESGTAKTLARLGLPTAKELQALAGRVTRVEAALPSLLRGRRSTPAKGARRIAATTTPKAKPRIPKRRSSGA